MRYYACCWAACGLVVAAGTHPAGGATTMGEAIAATANRLVLDQRMDGAWAGAEGYTGMIAAGLANAYLLTETDSYLQAAQRGGQYILSSAGEVGFYGDEAYGLTRLSEVSTDPAGNPWRDALVQFYARVATQAGGGTAAYISELQAGYAEDSVPLFYLAHHTVAAYYVNAADKALWRQAVINALALVNDNDGYPVMSLGAAVWALAQTGNGLDSSVLPVPPAPVRGDYAGKRLDELPGILAAHQASSGPYVNSFYYLFNHTDSLYYYTAGYTEDAIYGAMGLIAAHDSGWSCADCIRAARQALVNGDHYGDGSPGVPDLGVRANGLIMDHIWSGGFMHYAFMGETLTALTLNRPPLTPCNLPAIDADGDADVDQEDFGAFQACASTLLEYDEDRCRCFDQDGNERIDAADLAVFSHCISGPSIPADPGCDD